MLTVSVIVIGIVAAVAMPFVLRGLKNASAGELDSSAVPALGASSFTAARSCADVRSSAPSSENGVYWIQTSALEAPIKVRCRDGLTLIGRGREGWTFETAGQGDLAAVTETGAAAFRPAALPGRIIDGLADGAPIRSIIIRRAVDTKGTTFTDLVWRDIAMPAGWRWNFDHGYAIASQAVGPVTGTGGTTRDTTTTVWKAASEDGKAFRSVVTAENGADHHSKGFAWPIGGPAGTPDDTTFVYQAKGSPRSVPYAEVWADIRSSAKPITARPASALKAYVAPALPNPDPVAQEWYVTGRDHTNEADDWNYEAGVTSIAVANDVAYVAGRFTQVRSTLGTVIDQPSLAAFRISDGSFVNEFRPKIAGRVYTVEVAPDGDLLIGGDFNQVNGTDHDAIAKLDPLTGATDPAFGGQIRRLTTRGARVLTLEVVGNTAYAGGEISAMDGPDRSRLTQEGLVKFDPTTGSPDPAFRPVFAGNFPWVEDVRISADGKQLGVTGELSRSEGTPWLGIAGTQVRILSPTTGADVAVPPQIRPGNRSKEAVYLDENGRYWSAGAPHSIEIGNIATGALEATYSNVAAEGGRFQFVERFEEWMLTGAHSHAPQGVFTGAAPLNLPWRHVPLQWVMAIDRSTLEPVPWVPNLKSFVGAGPWDLEIDSRRCMWIGGDMELDKIDVGFVRLCPDDADVPTIPAGLDAVSKGPSAVAIEWQASTDLQGPVSYWLYRDGIVVGVTDKTSMVDPNPGRGTHNYVVRAIDSAGNRSAGSLAAEINVPEDPPNA